MSTANTWHQYQKVWYMHKKANPGLSLFVTMSDCAHDFNNYKNMCPADKNDHINSMAVRVRRSGCQSPSLGPQIVASVPVKRTGTKAEKEEDECVVCCVNKKDGCLVPCGHVFCVECADKVTECPNCRQHIERVVKMY